MTGNKLKQNIITSIYTVSVSNILLAMRIGLKFYRPRAFLKWGILRYILY